MTIVVVPDGAQAGLLDNTTLIPLETVCDVGSIAGVRDGSVSAWIEVRIVPFGAVNPDEWGRFLHVCVEFVQPAEWIGKRRREAPGWSTIVGPGTLKVECDPAPYWIGSWARLYATGGTAGDKYDITITTATMQQQSDSLVADAVEDGDTPPSPYQVDVFEPAFEFTLTSLSIANSDEPNVLLTGPGLPIHHTGFRLIEGTATWGGMPLTAPNGRIVTLNAPITTGINTIYQTCGWV